MVIREMSAKVESSQSRAEDRTVIYADSRVTNRLRAFRSLALAIGIGFVAGVHALAASADATLTPPAEIVRIMERSSLEYTFQIPAESEVEQEKPGRVLVPGLVLQERDGTVSVASQVLSPALELRMHEAENRFEQADFEGAIEIYEEVLKSDPTYYQGLTLIGDAYFAMGRMKTARRYFEQAIDSNFVDYQAHWFLADTLWSLGLRELALDEIVVAHLLNVNHAVLKEEMISFHKQMGQDWKNWTYAPRVQLRKDGNTVNIGCRPEWIGYCLVKAVWKYEPGYAESKGKSSEAVFFPVEEKEALAALLAHNDELPHIGAIVSDGFTDAFLLYERAAKKHPLAVLLLPREEFLRLKTYVEQYH